MLMPADLIVTVTPGPREVALAWLPDGARIHITGRDHPECPDIPVVEVAGAGMGYGAYIVSRWGPKGIGLGRHRRDRAMWQRAARQLAAGGIGGPVLYVAHEPADWCGKTVLVATRIRKEGET
jgi:hypothetical protein